MSAALRCALSVAVVVGLTGVGGIELAGATGAAPSADDATFQVWQDEEVAIALTANDPEDDPLTYSVGTPAHGVLTGAAPDLVYTPDPGYTGADGFTFTVDDGTTTSAAAVVTIDVMVPADITCRDATRTIDAGTTLAVGPWLTAVPALCAAPGGAAVSVDGAPTPGSGSIDGAGTYVPPAGFIGTDVVTVPVVADGGAARGTATLAVSIVDPDAPTGAGIGIGDVTVWEGDARTRSMAFPVTLATSSTAPVTVRYLISGIDAVGGTLRTPDVDFASKGSVERTLTFKPGQTSRFITVSVYGDVRIESDETLTVVLSDPTGGPAIADAVGVGIIRDDDSVAGAQVSVGDASIVEGDAGFRSVAVPLTLSEPVSGPVTVEYRIETVEATGNYSSGPVAPGTDVRDFGGATRTLTFPVSAATGLSATQRTLALRVFGDTATEDWETVEVRILSVIGDAALTDGVGVVTVLDDDLPLGTVAVRGTITDIGGARVAGALVAACVAMFCEATVTDGDGEYALADVSDQFAAMGWTTGAIVAIPPDDGSLRMSGYTALARRDGLQVVDLALGIGGRLGDVTLLAPDGSSAPSGCAATTTLTAASGTDDPRLVLGSFDFDGDRHHAGDYVVRLDPGPACPFSRAVTTVTIGVGVLTPLTVTLTEPSDLAGTIRDGNGDRVDGASVIVTESADSGAVWGTTGAVVATATTANDGTFTVMGLPVGTFDVQVTKAGATLHIPITVATPGSHLVVDEVFATPGVVAGTLLDGDGMPLTGIALVQFCPTPPATVAAQGCSGGVTAYAIDGNFSATLVPGVYRFVGGTMSSQSPQALVTVASGASIPCDLVAGPGGSVSCDESPPPAPKGQLHGTVLADDLSVIGGLVGVIACPASGYPTPSMGCTGGATVLASGVDGSYSVALDVGSYTVIGGTLAKLSPVVTVSITEGGSVTCEVRVGATATISCT